MATNSQIVSDGVSLPSVKRQAAKSIVGDGVSSPAVKSTAKSYLSSTGGDYMARFNNSTYNPNVAGAYIDLSGSSTAGGAGGAGSLQPAYDPADLAYLDDSVARLNTQMGSVDRAEQSGLTQLQDSYNRELSGANTNQSRALQDFATKREDTTRAKDTALGRVDSNARTLANSVRQRLGLASGSGSSAYQLAAPGAVARQATMNRTGVVENYGQNFRDLATNELRVKDDFQTLLGDLEAQRKERESGFKADILDRRNQISGSLAEVARQKAQLLGGGYTQARAAMAPYTSAIDSRQAEIDGLFDKYRTPFSVKAIDTTAPSLRDYVVDRANINANQTQGQDPTSPYGQFLRRDEEDNQLV